MKQDLDSIIDEICLKEDDFKLKNKTIRGVNYKCFDSKILNLNDYFKLSLKFPNNEMLIFEDERYTYEHSFAQSSAFANALVKNFGNPYFITSFFGSFCKQLKFPLSTCHFLINSFKV